MARPKRIADTSIRTALPPGRYSDGPGGNGLSLLVKETKTPGLLSKTWSVRLRINGKYTNRGLGSYAKVTLAEARRKALAYQQAVQEDRDPAAAGTAHLSESSRRLHRVSLPLLARGKPKSPGLGKQLRKPCVSPHWEQADRQYHPPRPIRSLCQHMGVQTSNSSRPSEPDQRRHEMGDRKRLHRFRPDP